MKKAFTLLVTLFLFFTGAKQFSYNETECLLATSQQYEINKNSSFIEECHNCLENCRIGTYYFGGYDLECINECSYRYICDYELLNLQAVYKSDICLFGTKMTIYKAILGLLVVGLATYI